MLLPGLIILLVFSHFLGQAGLSQRSRIEVYLGKTAAQPGSHASIPLTLNNRSEKKVQRLSTRLRFRRRDLSFLGAIPGIGTQNVKSQIKAEIKNTPSAEYQIVEVNVLGSGPLPSSILALLQFDVSRDAKAGSVIAIETMAVHLWSCAEDAIQPVAKRNGEIRLVESSFLPACFFYMH